MFPRLSAVKKGEKKCRSSGNQGEGKIRHTPRPSGILSGTLSSHRCSADRAVKRELSGQGEDSLLAATRDWGYEGQATSKWSRNGNGKAGGRGEEGPREEMARQENERRGERRGMVNRNLKLENWITRFVNMRLGWGLGREDR